MGREFELKYRADSSAFSALREQYAPFAAITMETTYYDTPDGALSRLHWTLRRRLENGISVCTVKTPAQGGGRGEWETQCGNIREAVPALVAMGAPEVLAILTEAGLKEVCGARFTRLAATLEEEGCTVELALDQGVLLGGGQECPLCEVEVELKSGSEAAAVRFAQALAARHALTPEPRSKVQRALALANLQK